MKDAAKEGKNEITRIDMGLDESISSDQTIKSDSTDNITKLKELKKKVTEQGQG